MPPDFAVKHPRGGQLGRRKPASPSTLDKMVDALFVWRVNLDHHDQVREVLRVSGFGGAAVDIMADIAVAAARKRHPGRH